MVVKKMTSLSVRMEYKKPGMSSKQRFGRRLNEEKNFEKLQLKIVGIRKRRDCDKRLKE